MTLRRFGLAALALSLAGAGCERRPPPPADPLAQARAVCADPAGAPEARIGACSEVIADADAPTEARADALAARGSLRQSAGDPTAALRDFAAALDLLPDHAPAKFGRASVLVASGQLDAAAPLLDELAAAGFAPARVHALRGDLFARARDRGRALREYDAALSADPGLAHVFAARGALKDDIGDGDGARVDYDRALDLDPDNAAALSGRCWSRVRGGGDLADARRDAERAISGDATLVSAQLCLGLVLLRAEQWEEARAAYDAVLAREPAHAAALFGRGFARREAGERSEGAADIRRAYDFNSAIDEEFEALGVDF